MIQEDRRVIPLRSLPFTFPCVLVHLMRHSIRLWESPSSFLSVFYYSHFPCLFIYFSYLFSAYRPRFFSSYILHSDSHFALVLFKVRNLKWWRIKENKWMSRTLNACSVFTVRAFLSSHSYFQVGKCSRKMSCSTNNSFCKVLRTPVWTILHRWKKAYLFNVCVKGNLLVKNNLVMSSRVGFWLDPVQKKTFIKI